MEREFILSEVRRTAAENGGIPIGRLRLESECGIKAYDWKKYWSRFSDAVREAGFKPNAFGRAYTDDERIKAVISLTRELGRFPTEGDMLVKRTSDDEFPSRGVFRRLGRKSDIIAKVSRYCVANAGHDDVLELCQASTVSRPSEIEREIKIDKSKDGFVYLMRSGKHFKIGKSVHAGARERQLAIQLPAPVATVHVIRTDDPSGIEAYWHNRFKAKRKNGEWFDLNREDVAMFKRRKFM